MANTRQLNHHLLGILFRHFEIGNRVEQIDMAYFLTSAYETVQRLHKFSRIKTIALAKINKEAFVALLRLILQLLLVRLVSGITRLSGFFRFNRL